MLELLTEPDDDPIGFELRTPDTDPDTRDEDRLGQRIEQDTSWGLPWTTATPGPPEPVDHATVSGQTWTVAPATWARL